MKIWLGALAVIAVIAFVVWYEIAVWDECLKKHSWWYCMRILGR
jgi:hypothetical protein